MILRGNFFSKTLEMETGITVALPNNFTGEGYKVVYLLHGLCGRNGDWVDYTMLPVYKNDYNVIFIMPEVARSFYTDMQYGQKFFSYVTEELPSIVKSVFNISAKREDTAVIGASMGGYGALKCALTKPETYGFCAAISSACLFLKDGLAVQRSSEHTPEFRAMYGEQLINDFHAIFGDDLAWQPEYEILELAKKVNMEAVRPKLYLACGTEDYMYQDNLRLRDELKKLSIDFSYEEWQGIHDWYFFNEGLNRALKFCFGK